MPDRPRQLSEMSEELIQLAIDREATPEQRAQLEALAASSDEVRQAQRSFEALGADLREIAVVHDAPDFAPQILAAIRRSASPAKAVPFRRRAVFLGGWAAAAVAAGIALLTLTRTPEQIPRERARATMTSPEATGTNPLLAEDFGAWALLSRASMDGVSDTGFEVRRKGNTIAVLLENAAGATLTWDERLRMIQPEIAPVVQGKLLIPNHLHDGAAIFEIPAGSSGLAEIRLTGNGSSIGTKIKIQEE